MQNKVDEKAVRILLKYNLFAPQTISDDEFIYAKKAGLLFDLEEQTHDKIIDAILIEFGKIKRVSITDLFLSSLSTNRLDWRVGLSAYAIARVMPSHVFKPFSEENQVTCAICCTAPHAKVNRSFLNLSRFVTGGTTGLRLYDLYFNLEQHSLLTSVLPKEEDFRIFSDILTIFLDAPQNEVPSKIEKKVKKIAKFKSTEEQRRVLIETLGYCSILETQTHKGFLTKFTNMCQAPRKSRSSDWHYPVDWWTGSDGINKEAIEFWFGDYPQLEKYWK